MKKIIKTISKILIAAMLMTNLIALLPEFTFAASGNATQKQVLTDREKSEIIVVYNDDSTSDSIKADIKGKLKLKKLDTKRKFKKSKADLLEIDKSDDISKVVEELKKDRHVKYAQPNYPIQISSVSDPQFNKQWGLLNNGQSVEGQVGRSNVDINAMNAWNLTQGSGSVVIGVLDTGIDINHEDLKDNIVPGWDFVNDDATVYDDPGLDLHGTEVAGIIAAEANSTGISGVAPNVKIMPLKFISGTVGYTCDAISAIEYAMDHDVKIINCSFGGSDNNQALKDTMANSGILFVCAAGNRGADVSAAPVYPACFDIPNVISVAAIDQKGVLANFSSYGSKINVAAPGVNILTTMPGTDSDGKYTYDYLSGTSASAPFVAGIAALLKSYLPNLTITQIADRIKQNVVPCTNLAGKVSTGGRVDAFAALTDTKPAMDTYTGPGNDSGTVNVGQGGDTDAWYTQDQLARIKEKLHYGESGVSPASGNFSMTVNDMSIPAPGFNINISRSYNSKDEKSTPLGRGWTFGFEGSAKGTDLVTVTLPTGSTEQFRQNTDGTYTAQDSRSTFVKNTDNTYTMKTKDQYTYGFDTNGWLNWMKDRNGNTVNITVDANGKVTKITDTVGRDYIVTYRPDNTSLIDNIKDMENRTVKYEYDANNRLWAVTDPMGGKMFYEYDGSGFLNKIKDNNGTTVETLTYNHTEGDNKDKVSQAIDSLGDTVNYAYDMLNKKTTITDMNKRVSTYWFDTSMYTIKVQDPDGRCSLTEYYLYGGKNQYGDVRSTTDRNGNRTEFTLDAAGNITKELCFANNSTQEYTYDDKNNVTSEKDESGKLTYNIYDADKINLIKKVQPLNGTDPYTDGTSNPANYAITAYNYYSKAEAQSQFNCNAAALLKSVTDPENNTTTYTYDCDGNTKTITDAENNTTTNEYNRIGWKTAEVSAKGERTENTYDKNGQLIKTVIANGNGEATRTVNDILGRKIQEILPNQYDPSKDNVTSDTYSDNTVGTRYEYLNNGLLNKMTDPEGNITLYTYDVYGNKLTETRPNGSILRYEYDVMDRLTKTYFKDNATATETLLSEDSYAVLEDGKSQKTETTHLNDTDTAITVTISDFAGRTVEQQNPDGTKVKTSYNSNGTVGTTTSTTGSISYYKYDGLNRLTEQWVPFEVSNGSILYSYTKNEYDKAGNKTAEKAGKDKVALYAVPQSMAINNYTYYKNGKVKAVIDNEGRKTEYAYDADGNTIKEDIYTDAVNKNTTEYVYNYLGKVEQKNVHVRAGDIASNDFNNNTDLVLTTSYTYDKNGNVKTTTDPKGVVTTYTYDNLDRQLSVSQPGVDENNSVVAITTSTTYNYEDKPITTTDANGNLTTYEYNPKGLLTKVTDPKGGVTAYDYDRAGRKIIEVSPKNYASSKALGQMNRIEYLYDNMDRLRAKTDIYLDDTSTWVTAVTKSYKYDNSGNVIKELDALGYDAGTGSTTDEKISTGYGTEYTYNLAAKAVTVTDAVSKQRALPYTTQFGYDALGRKTTETNAKGVISLYTYNDAGNITKISRKKNQTAAEQTLKTSTYDLAGNLLTQTDGNGNTTIYQSNAFGKTKNITTPGDATIDSNIVTYQYDENGNLKKQSDNMGKVDTYTYDNQGRALSHTKNNITTSVKYDKNGNKRFETDESGVIKESVYDNLNKLITTKITVSGNLQTTGYGYDANGNQTTITDWRGNTSTNIYDPLNRLVEKHDPYTTIQKLTYYKNNLQAVSYDALNNPTTFFYDRNGRLASTTDPEGHTTTQAYDDAGNIQTKADGRNISTTYNYDEFNRLKSVVNAKGEATSYTYDLNGNMLTQTDGNGNTTIFCYDVANKLIKKTDPNGTGDPKKTESYIYFADGSMKTKLDRNGKTTYYNYDIYGRLLSQVCDTASISYTYDNNGNQLTMTDGTGTTTRTYDELSRVLTKTVPDFGTTTYQYDIITGVPDGDVGEKSTDPKGNVTLKVSDKAGRLLTVTADNKTTTYGYNPNGSRQSVTYPDGAAETYTYYKDGLNKTLVNKKADGSTIDSYSYTYDAAHNQTSKTDSKGVTKYTYDSLNRLETVTEPNGKVTIYTFDKAGNRLTETVTAEATAITTTYTYNEQNRLTKTITQNGPTKEVTYYTYDANGNMYNKDVSYESSLPPQVPVTNTLTLAGQNADDTSAEYRYDVWNQMVKSVEGANTTINTYNGDGLRVQKTVNGQTTRYLYEAENVVLETDGAGNQTARNVYGTNLLARTMGSDTAYCMYNGHADVTALLANGTVAATYYYDAFGNVVEKNENAGVNNPYRYAGYQYDSETSLYYLNARFYDAKIARFMSEDTVRGQANDPLSLNLYTYCSNNPIKYDDPTGHTTRITCEQDAINLVNELNAVKTISSTTKVTSSEQAAKVAKEQSAKTDAVLIKYSQPTQAQQVKLVEDAAKKKAAADAEAKKKAAVTTKKTNDSDKGTGKDILKSIEGGISSKDTIYSTVAGGTQFTFQQLEKNAVKTISNTQLPVNIGKGIATKMLANDAAEAARLLGGTAKVAEVAGEWGGPVASAAVGTYNIYNDCNQYAGNNKKIAVAADVVGTTVLVGGAVICTAVGAPVVVAVGAGIALAVGVDFGVSWIKKNFCSKK